MKKVSFGAITIFAVAFSCLAHAQEKIITTNTSNNNIVKISSIIKQVSTYRGNIVDSNGKPVIGAAIKNLTTGDTAITDTDGNFSIKASPGDKLEISCLGYISVRTVVPDHFTITMTITLQDDI